MLKKLLLLLSLSFTILSCKYDLLPSPDSNGNSSLSQGKNKIILPPENLQATQGDYRSITLSWSPVKNATQYQIFSANTEFDKFEKKGETKGSVTSFTIQETSGTSKAYYVCSVDYYGKISRPSLIVKGTTLAVPIITEITKSSAGDFYTLNWWMPNCSSETYENEISYTLNCYEDNSTTPLKIELPGNQYSYDFTTLKQSTNYKFTVESYKTNTKQKHEISDSEPIETGHRIVPDAVKNLTITKGNNKTRNQIKIEFELPPLIESYNEKDSVYEKNNPIYFTIKRHLINDNYYETVYDYIGIGGTKNETGKKIILPNYTEGTKITVEDDLTDSLRGKQLEYIIQSYTDKNDKNLTSEKTSVASDIGWLISPVDFKTKDSITCNPENESLIDSITVNFSINFMSFDVPYTYTITEKKYSIDDKNDDLGLPEKVILSTQDISAIEKQSHLFNDIANQIGYYEYKLYISQISDDSSSIPASYYECITSPSKVTVISDLSRLPNITFKGANTFDVQDGYSDHYQLFWDSIADDCIYTLSWKNKIDDGYTETQTTVEFTEKSDLNLEETGLKISVKDNIVSLRHNATSGEIRSYTLTASNGLTKSTTKTEDFYTLGTAEPRMPFMDYSSITVEWDCVQKVKDDFSTAYKIAANYRGESTNLLTNDNYTLTEDKENNKIICVINKPEGYDDARKSGRPIDLKITSYSENDQTISTDTVYTLGPAAINLITDNDYNHDHITISWNKIDNANSYIVFRTVMDSKLKMESSGDMFYIEGNNVFDNEGSKLSTVAVSSFGNTIILTDTYSYSTMEIASSDALKRNQNKICWGIPFGYTVIPVISQRDAQFDIENNMIINSIRNSTANTAAFSYKNLEQKISCTNGYGLNVQASKATSNKSVKITWTQPYKPENKVPKIYRRKNADSNWVHIPITINASSEETMMQEINYESNDTNTYEYAVVYSSSDFEDSYIDVLNATYDTVNSPTEKLNKGYILSLPNNLITASSAGGFNERFDWTDSTYDFEQRSQGPDYYEIQILNKNRATGWTAIATIPIDLSKKDYGSKATEDFRDTTKVILKESSSYQAVFSPVFEDTNISEGQLQVLRDYKHYYRLVAVKNTDGQRKNAIEAIADTHMGTDNISTPAFAIRDISEEELMHCVSLIIADAINQAGVSSGGDRNCEGQTGKFKITHPGATKDIEWGTYGNEYQHKFSSGLPYETEQTKQFVSPFIIKMANEKCGNAADGSSLYHLPKGSITVTNVLGNSTYGDGSTLTFTMGYKSKRLGGVEKRWIVSINYKSKKQEVIEDNQTEYQKIFPFDLASNRDTKNFNYNKDLTEFKSPWWDSKEGE